MTSTLLSEYSYEPRPSGARGKRAVTFTYNPSDDAYADLDPDYFAEDESPVDVSALIVFY